MVTGSGAVAGVSASADDAAPARRTGRRFVALFGLGLVGVATLPFALVPLVRSTRLPHVAAWPLPAQVALLMVNPVLYLAAGVALGLRFAPRLGLRSLVAERAGGAGEPLGPALRTAAPAALASGAALGATTALLDRWTAPLLGPAWRAAAARLEAQQGTGPGPLVTGLFYGGITEELMVRWGVMSLLAWLAVRATGRRAVAGGTRVVLLALGLAALLFGAGHLPPVAALVPLTPAVVARTVALNALGGLLFGWWFWRRHVEAAMLAHAGAHLGLAGAALLAA
jgi:hypothetical protein